MCDLGLTIEGTELEARIAQLNAEIDARGLTFRPYYWLSDEWFTPDGVPGIAIPFYLAHPRLAKLEFAQMLEVEGGDPEVVHADPAARGGARHRQRLRAAAPADAATAVRHPGHRVSRVLHAETVQQELRPASRSLVRAEPSRRRFRRNVRRLARPELHVGDALRRLAGAAEARIHGSADAGARAQCGRASARSGRWIRCRG